MALNSPQSEAPANEANVITVGKSELACESCRRRKAKCDRTLPCCILCSKNSQTCTYPPKKLKPGPKLGSSQCSRKRVRFNASRESQEYDRRSSVDGDFEADTQRLFPPERAERGKRDKRRRKGSMVSSSKAILHFENPLPPSPETTESDDTLDASDSSDVAATNFVRAITLSSLIHPTHESCLTPPTSVADQPTSGFFVNLAGTQELIIQACESFNLSIATLQALIDSYFENMTSFSLFHQPSFGTKIQGIKNILHLKALFAAIFSFSARFDIGQPQDTYHMPDNYPENLSHEQFHALALRFIDEALDECADEIPPLCLLQALTLSTFYELTNGVRGRAWRLLGSCVRVAYELRLHLIDYEGRVECPKVGIDLARWSADEERRRCWWAIWEMDTFASTIRRCPNAIDWTMIDTYLPVKDELWFNNQYQASCFFERKPMNRWKKLKKSGNESPVAWFIILNSIMRNAQVLSRGNLQGILTGSDANNNVAQLTHYFRNTSRKKRSEEDSTELTILVHALRCTTSVLPESLVYRGENLNFSSREAGLGARPEEDGRRMNSAKYTIYLMTQLARFMVYHHYAFGEIVSGTIFTENPRNPDFGWTVAEQEPPMNCEGLRNCLEAADNILAITNRCADNHVRYVNPFLASTVWLATSLQILRKVFAPDARSEMTESKCEILRLSCHQYAQFWRTPLALLENLDTLEERLIMRRNLSAALEKEAMKTNKERERRSSLASRALDPKRQSLRNNNVEWVGAPRPSQSSPIPLDLDGMTSFQSPATSASYVDNSMAGFESGACVPENTTTALDPSTYMTPDEMNMEQGFGDDFVWYLSGLMSESLSR